MPKDALEILIEDHRKAKDLFQRIEDTEDDAECERLWSQLANDLRAHVTIEKEIFYPRIKPKLQGVVDDEVWEKQEIEETEGTEMLEELDGEDLEDEEWMEKFREFKDTELEHATEDEEGQLFPKVREKLSKTELENLGRDMQKRHDELHRQLEARAR